MAVNVFTMALMPISQAICWICTLKAMSSNIYPLLRNMAAFYCLWALYNRFFVTPKELGQITTGFLAVSAHLRSLRLTRIGLGLVIINYIVPVAAVGLMSARDLAQLMKHDTETIDIVWAHLIKLYFVSNIVLWSYALRKLPQKEQPRLPK